MAYYDTREGESERVSERERESLHKGPRGMNHKRTLSFNTIELDVQHNSSLQYRGWAVCPFLDHRLDALTDLCALPVPAIAAVVCRPHWACPLLALRCGSPGKPTGTAGIRHLELPDLCRRRTLPQSRFFCVGIRNFTSQGRCGFPQDNDHPSGRL